MIDRRPDNKGQMGALLEILRTGCVLLDRNRRVRFSNKIAETAVEGSDVLAIIGATFTAHASDHARMIRERHHRCLTVGTPQHAALERENGGRPVLLTFVPVRVGGGAEVDQVIVSVCDLQLRNRTVSAPLLRDVLQLTVAEANVAVRLCDGLSIGATADALGISTGTARNHLKSIFSKLGVRRQSELVIYLIEGIGPLASGAVVTSQDDRAEAVA